MTAPYKGKLQVEAYEAGRAARVERKGLEDCPGYTRRSLTEAWQQGWKDAAPQEPERARGAQVGAATAAPTRETHPHLFWPETKAWPTVYSRPPVPCPPAQGGCGRILTDDGGRACVMTQGPWGDPPVVRFRCRCCRVRFKLAAS